MGLSEEVEFGSRKATHLPSANSASFSGLALSFCHGCAPASFRLLPPLTRHQALSHFGMCLNICNILIPAPTPTSIPSPPLPTPSQLRDFVDPTLDSGMGNQAHTPPQAALHPSTCTLYFNYLFICLTAREDKDMTCINIFSMQGVW